MGIFDEDVDDGGEEFSLVPQLEEPGSGHPLHKLEISDAIRERLVADGLSEEEIDALLSPPAVQERPQDDSYPLSCYFISTSHNTYLTSRQLLGVSSPTAYTHVITKGCRCIEIDAWDGSDSSSAPAKPIVTHGLTLTESTPFEDVVRAIGDAITDDMWPVMVSLENHANDQTQREMVRIMREVWGTKLVDQSVEGFDKHVPPSELKGRILLIVEWYPENPVENPDGELSDTDSDRDDDEQESEKSEGKLSSLMERLKLKKSSKNKHVHPKIIPELAELGVYAKSVKPKKNWLSQPVPEDPTNLFLNISESAMSSILPAKVQEFIVRGAAHQVRIYPKGTRIRSNNYNPTSYWRGGAQICAQNWQRFDKGMQLTRAMFEGTNGWKLKPRALLAEHAREIEENSEEHEGVEDVEVKRPMIGPHRFQCEILGASGIPLRSPLPEDETAKLYITAQLYHSSGDVKWRSPTVPATFSSSSSRDKLDLAPTSEEAFKFTWEFDAGDASGDGADPSLTFLRFLIVRDIKLERDVKLGIYCVALDVWKTGLQALRLTDPNGNIINSSLLVRSKLTRAS